MFDGYQFNVEKANGRYECVSERPIKIAIFEKGRKQCKCGEKLVPLAYVYDDGYTKSMTLTGRKCSCCGQNYFTAKTVSKCELAFEVENGDLHISSPSSAGTQKILNSIKRGDIYYADLMGLENYCGFEQTGRRPVLVVQNDKGNRYSGTTVVATITSKIKDGYPTHVLLKKGILNLESMVCLEQLKTIDKQRLEQYITTLDEEIMRQINRAILVSLGIK
jgi:mRNA interferase MazF